MDAFLSDENLRLEAFPVCRKRIFMAHAGVSALPRAVADAVVSYTEEASTDQQEFGDVLARILQARTLCADFLGGKTEEIALLGPTSLGLSLVANGLAWADGDEVVCYRDDYPANVYPWMNLERLGVKVRFLEPAAPGEITPGLVESALNHRTKLVALASCHFLSGFRIDVDAIGKVVHDAGALFCLDAIQTLGAFPTCVDHVDFLSADSHKWMLGPLTAGIFFVKKTHFERLRPSLIGAWNVDSPNFIAQDAIRFAPTAQRYEPGVLNAAGIFGMAAAIAMFARIGMDRIAERILHLKSRLVAGLESAGCRIYGPREGANASGITTFYHPDVPGVRMASALESARISASHRHDRAGNAFIRLSPHFYNTEIEVDRVVGVVQGETCK